MQTETVTVNGEKLAHLVSEYGRAWRVRVLLPGDKYGLNDCLTHTGEPVVEFYDATYAGDDRFGGRGQFVSRYGLAMLDGTDSYSRGRIGVQGQGLCLDGGIPVWSLDGPTAARALLAAERMVAERVSA